MNLKEFVNHEEYFGEIIDCCIINHEKLKFSFEANKIACTLITSRYMSMASVHKGCTMAICRY